MAKVPNIPFSWDNGKVSLASPPFLPLLRGVEREEERNLQRSLLWEALDWWTVKVTASVIFDLGPA